MNAIKIIVALVVMALGLPSANALEDDAALATAWNQTVLEIAEAEDGFLTLKGLRTVTMMHIAMHDALSSINGEYQTFAYGGDSRPCATNGCATSIRTSRSNPASNWVTRLRAPYLPFARVMVGMQRLNIAGTRWRRACTPSFKSTAERRKGLSLERAGPKPGDSPCGAPINFERRRHRRYRVTPTPRPSTR